MMHLACLFLHRWNENLQTFAKFTKHYLFEQFMARKTNSWYPEIISHLYFGIV